VRQSTIARNYAAALLVLAQRAEDLRGWGTLIQSIADAMQRDQKLRAFLETPRVDAATKNAVLRKALADRAPSKFVRFIEAVVQRRRQMLIPEIAYEYLDLVDQAENRLHADVTVSREADDKSRKLIADRLSKVFHKTVVPHLSVDSRILGGAIVRVGDTVMDGSVR
jgi:F-type H+-transporting ATPase subunit delta